MAAVLAAARLRFAARLSRRAPAYLHSLVQSSAGSPWRQAVLADLQWLAIVMRDKVGELPPPLADPEAWEHLWQHWPFAWLGLVKSFLRRAAEDPRATLVSAAAVGVVPVDALDADAAPDGADPPAADLERHGPFVPPPPAVVTCYECGLSFARLAGLKVHARVVHGVRRPGHRFVANGVCPACGGDYRNRLRCLQHLERASQPCRAALDAGLLPEVAPDVLAEAEVTDRLWRRSARAEGRSELAGLPAIRASIG